MDDGTFLAHVADRLGGLPGVEAVSLGGSRAEGTHRPDSDWDFSVYYRGHFDPQALRDLGWPGEASEVGGWSSGVFNGGAWLEVDGREAWWGRAEATFGYARAGHAAAGRLAQCAGLVAQGASQAAHAVLAARGEWVTNEKSLLTKADLRQVDDLVAAAQPDPDALRDLVDRARAAARAAIRDTNR